MYVGILNSHIMVTLVTHTSSIIIILSVRSSSDENLKFIKWPRTHCA